MREATDHQITATALACARDLQDRMRRYPTLFPDPPLGPDTATRVAQAIAWGAPWCTPAQLRAPARTALWIFAVDWLIDHQATGAEQVRALVDGCLRVADGHPPQGALETMLAELRADLADRDAMPVWREELRRMLTAMEREWAWVAGHAPTWRQYLDNADNFGSTWVNVTHWIVTGDDATREHLDVLRRASRLVQQALRLYNDLATIGRDRSWGDLNALMLGLDETAARRHIDDLITRRDRCLEPLRTACPRQITYLRRQIEYSAAFYGDGRDYWGTLDDESVSDR
ncbi:terpene synthase family protein [Actinomadura kijaniata]|uniref:terpene synthase family protein n=1 Tax=Actinomadura kijaniata TaxID=46161 RepID=UPI000837054F|nr:terpene synthase family protein [Actinomadura kijaniata]